MDAKRIVTIVAVAAIAVILVLVLVRGCDEEQATTGASGGTALAGETLDGGSFDLADTRGRPTVVNFFASWCPPCNEEAPELVAFAEAHPDIAFVGVATNDKLDDAKGFVDQYGIEFPAIFDGEGALGGPWGIEYLPTTLFLDADGREVDRIVGGATRAQFEEKLEAVQ
jgi:thiol-disulfide isomerase/thioredoxin